MMKRLRRWWLRNLWDKLLSLEWGLFKGVRGRVASPKRLPIALALETLETRTLPSAQWANSVLGFSSQNSAGNWSAMQAVGTPNTTFYGHFPTAWAPSAMNGTQEYLSVGFQNNVYASGVTVRETNGNGFITKVDLIDTANGLHTVWTGTDSTPAGSPADFTINFATTTYLVKGVKVYVDTNRNLSTFEEIDAVQLNDAAVAAPTITGVSPNTGPTSGGTSVTITGTNFTGATQVSFGGTAATSFTVVSATQIMATSPARAAGVIDITVTTPGGTSAVTAADQFTYTAPAPAIISVSPNSGTTAGGTSVTITGTNFTGATQVSFGGTAATSFTVVSATQITATSPARAAGVIDITVTTTGGTSAVTAADQFTYVAPAPSITNVSPNSGTTAGGTLVTITGTNFTGATQVSFGGTAASSFTVVSATQITATSPAHAAGLVDITVTTPGGTSAIIAADQFTYSVPAPTITSVSPNSGTTAGGTLVTITGTNFTGATQVSFGGTPAASFTIVSATQITATAPPHAAGAVDITVTTSGGTSAVTAADQFTYNVPAPTVTSISPTAGPTAGGTMVIVTGTNFTGTTQVWFGASAATSFFVNSATQITATAPPHAAGTVDVTITTPGGTSATSSTDEFTYDLLPRITTITPNSGPTTGGTVVTIMGSNLNGATQVTFGGVNATSFTVVSAMQITATAPAHAVGSVHVSVTTPDGTSSATAADLYSYYLPPPTAVADDYTMSHDGTLSISAAGILANDSNPAGGTLSVVSVNGQAANVGTALTLASGGTLTAQGDGSFVYVAAPNAVYQDSFTYVASNGTDTSNTATVTIHVVNHAPSATNDSLLVLKDQTTSIDLVLDVSDADLGDSLTVIITQGPAHGTLAFNAATGLYDYTPDAGYLGNDSFAFKANDGLTDGNTATVQITVIDPATASSTALSSLNARLPRRLDPRTGMSLQLLLPSVADLDTQLTFGGGSTIIAGTYSFTVTGTYDFAMEEGNNAFVIGAGGTVDFTYVETGRLDSNGIFTPITASLLQSATVDWDYYRVTGGGGLALVVSGTDTFTTIGKVFNPFSWQTTNWRDVIRKVSNRNGLEIESAASWFAVYETGSQSYQVDVSGTKVYFGMAGQDLIDMNQTGQQTSMLTGSATFTYGNSGNNLFELSVGGNYSPPQQNPPPPPPGSPPTIPVAFSFNSISYDEDGNDPGYGFTFAYDETGTLTHGATGSTGNATAPAGGSFGQSFQYSSQAVYSYHEGGGGGSLFHQGGTGEDSRFSLSSVSYDASGWATYSQNYSSLATKVVTSNGMGLATGSAGIGQGTMSSAATTMLAGTSTTTTATTIVEYGVGGFGFLGNGTYGHATDPAMPMPFGTPVYNLADFELNANAAGIFDADQTITTTSLATGSAMSATAFLASFAQGTSSGQASQTIAGTFSSQSQSTVTIDTHRDGAFGFGLHQEGAARLTAMPTFTAAPTSLLTGTYAPSFSLTSYSLDSEIEGNYDVNGSSSSVETVSTSISASGTSTSGMTTVLGGTTQFAPANYSFTALASYNAVATRTASSHDYGVFAQSTYLAGQYNLGTVPYMLALDSVVLAQSRYGLQLENGSHSSNYFGGQSYSATGGGMPMLATNFAGLVGNMSGTTAFEQASTGSFSGSTGGTWTMTGAADASQSKAGSYQARIAPPGAYGAMTYAPPTTAGPSIYGGGQFAFTSIVLEESGLQTRTSQASGSDSASGSGSQSWSATAYQSSTSILGTSSSTVAGTMTSASGAAFNQSNSSSWSQATTAHLSWDSYRAGSSAGGTLALTSISTTRSSNDTWTAQWNGSSSQSGNSSWSMAGDIAATTSMAFGMGSGLWQTTRSFSQGGSDSYSSSFTENGSASGDNSSFLSQRGSFAGGGYSLSSVVSSGTSTAHVTDDVSGTSDSTASAYQSMTVVSSQSTGGNFSFPVLANNPLIPNAAGTLTALVTTTGQGVQTYTAQSSSAQTASASFSKNTQSDSDSTRYRSGSYAAGAYALDSMALTANQSTSWSGQQADSWSVTRSDASALSGLGTLTSSGVAGNKSWTNVDASAFVQASSVSQSQAGASTVTASGSGHATSSQEGTLAAGLFSFGTVVFDADGTSTNTRTSTGSRSLLASSTDSQVVTSIRSGTIGSGQQSGGTGASISAVSFYDDGEGAYADGTSLDLGDDTDIDNGLGDDGGGFSDFLDSSSSSGEGAYADGGQLDVGGDLGDSGGSAEGALVDGKGAFSDLGPGDPGSAPLMGDGASKSIDIGAGLANLGSQMPQASISGADFGGAMGMPAGSAGALPGGGNFASAGAPAAAAGFTVATAAGGLLGSAAKLNLGAPGTQDSVTTKAAAAAYAYSSEAAYTDTASQTNSWSLHQAGSLSCPTTGSLGWNLGCVVYAESGTSTWSGQETSAATSTSDSVTTLSAAETTVYSGATVTSNMPYPGAPMPGVVGLPTVNSSWATAGTTANSNSKTTSKNGSATSGNTVTYAGDSSYSQNLEGSYNGSFSFATMVYQSQSSSNMTAVSQSADTTTSSSNSTHSDSGNVTMTSLVTTQASFMTMVAGTAMPTVTSGTSVQSGTSNSSWSQSSYGSQSGGSTNSSFDTTTLSSNQQYYALGSRTAAGVWSLSSVAYSGQQSSSSSYTQSDQHNQSAAQTINGNSTTVQSGALTNWQQSTTGTSTVTSTGTYSASSSQSGNSNVVGQQSSADSWLQSGVYSNGSFNLAVALAQAQSSSQTTTYGESASFSESGGNQVGAASTSQGTSNGTFPTIKVGGGLMAGGGQVVLTDVAAGGTDANAAVAGIGGNYTYGGMSVVGMQIYLNATSARNSNFTATGSSSSSGTEYIQTSDTLEQAGVYSQGLYSFGNVVQTNSSLQSAQSSEISSESRTDVQSGNMSSTQSYANGANTYFEQNSSSGGQNVSAFAGSTVTSSGLQSTTWYQAGSYAPGTVSLSSMVYKSLSSSQQTVQYRSQDTTTESSNGSSTVAGTFSGATSMYDWGGATQLVTRGGNSNASSTQSMSQSSNGLFSMTDYATSFTQRYQSGSFADNSWSLDSVNFTASYSDSKSQEQTVGSSGTMGSSMTATGSTQASMQSVGSSTQTFSNSATDSATQWSSQSAWQSSTSGWTVNAQGSFAGNSFALDTVSYSLAGGSSYTLMQNETSNVSHSETASSGWTFTADNGYVWARSGTENAGSLQSRTADSLILRRQNFSLAMAGSFSGGAYTFSSATYTQSAQQTVDATQTKTEGKSSLLTMSSTTPASTDTAMTSLVLGFMRTKAAQPSSVSVEQTEILGRYLLSSSTLTQSGSLNSQGWNLGSVSYQAQAENYYSATNTANFTVTQRLDTTTSAVVTHTGNSTSQYLGTLTYSENDQGSYANGSYAWGTFVHDLQATSRLTTTQWNTRSDNVAGTTTLATSGGNVTLGPGTSLECWQNATLTQHEQGNYTGGTWSLSCFVLDASLESGSRSRVNTSISNTLTSTNQSGQTMVSTSASNMKQALDQSSLGTLHYEGQYNGGSWSLSSVSFDLRGTSSFDGWSNLQLQNREGSATGTILYSTNLTATGTGLGTYHATGLGTSGPAGLSLTFTLDGGSTGSFSSTENGFVYGGGSTTFHIENGSQGTSSYSMAASVTPAGWNFSNYSSTVQSYTRLFRQVDGGTEVDTASQQNALVTGSGATGTQTSSGWNRNGSTITDYPTAENPSPPMPVTLSGPDVRPLAGLAEATPWASPAVAAVLTLGTGTDVAGVLGSMAQALGPLSAPAGWAGVPSASGRLWLAVPVLASPGMLLPPRPQGIWLGPLNGWVGQKTANLQGGAWGWLGYEATAMWARVGGSFQQALSRFQDARPDNNPTALTPTWWRSTINFIGGFLDTLTFGLTRIIRENLGSILNFLTSGLSGRLGWTSSLNYWGSNVVDMSSDAYRYGTYAGQIADIALTLIPGVGATRLLGRVGARIVGALATTARVLRPVQIAGGVLSAGEAALQGNFTAAALQLVGAGLRLYAARRGASSVCDLLQGSRLDRIVGRATQGFTIAGASYGAYQGVQEMRRDGGDATRGWLMIGQAGAHGWRSWQACFTGETKILTRLGWIRFDQLTELDEVASANEHDPHGPVEFKRVSEVYHFPPARIWHVHVRGQVIRTTAEHPFYVWGKGWIAAQELQAGDRLRSDDGQMVVVDEVFDSGVEEAVYNCAVAEYHTYFVGDSEWNFSVWAHNRCTPEERERIRALRAANPEMSARDAIRQVRWMALYHGSRDGIIGGRFDLAQAGSSHRPTHASGPGIYLTDDPARAATQYATPRGQVARVIVPRALAATMRQTDRYGRTEYVATTPRQIRALTRQLRILSQRDAVRAWVLGGG